jgi:Flp pilus assembly protein CpaB
MALAAFGLFFVLGGVLGGGAARVGGGNTPVVVAARDIPLRSVISADQLKVIGYASGDVPPGAFSDTRKVQGLAAELNIAAGQPVTSNMVAKSPDQITGPQPAYLPLPAGFVAITIPAGEQLGVAGYPQAGDYVTVIATVQTGGTFGGAPKTVVKTVFTNLHIIRVGPAASSVAGSSSSSQGQQQGGLSSSFTVVMTQCDAEFMTWFLNSQTSMKYTLESYQDYLKAPPSKPDPQCPAITGTKGVTAADVDARWGFTKA